MNIPELPIQVVAVTDAPATNYHHTQELNQVLVAEVISIIITIFSIDLSCHPILILWRNPHLLFLLLFYFHYFSLTFCHQGNNLADQLNAHFMTSETNQKKNNFYNNFFREVQLMLDQANRSC